MKDVKKFSMEDLKLDEMLEDEIFLTVDSAGDGNTTDWTENTISIVTGFTWIPFPNPTNTFTEINCC